MFCLQIRGRSERGDGPEVSASEAAHHEGAAHEDEEQVRGHEQARHRLQTRCYSQGYILTLRGNR